jgi:hypothetical protein
MASRFELSQKVWELFRDLHGVRPGDPSTAITRPLPFLGTDPQAMELAIPFLSASVCARTVAERDTWFSCAQSQIDFALGLEDPLGLLVTGKNSNSLDITDNTKVLHPDGAKRFLHADFHSRHIYNLYIAYQVRKDPALYFLALWCAEMMFRHIPMGLARELPAFGKPGLVLGVGRDDPSFGIFPYRGEILNLFTTDFAAHPDPDAPHSPERVLQVDGNNCAQIGLAFALMAADPLFPKDGVIPELPTLHRPPLTLKLTVSKCQEIAMHHIMASMSCQVAGVFDPTQPDVPIAGSGEVMDASKFPDCFHPDTLYGGLSVFCWVWVMKLDIFGSKFGKDWTAPGFQLDKQFHQRIRLAAKWLGAPSKMSMLTGCEKYRDGRVGVAITDEYATRLPLFWYVKDTAGDDFGVDGFIGEVFDKFREWTADPPQHLDQLRDHVQAPWAYYHAMGFTDFRQRLGIDS